MEQSKYILRLEEILKEEDLLSFNKEVNEINDDLKSHLKEIEAKLKAERELAEKEDNSEQEEAKPSNEDESDSKNLEEANFSQLQNLIADFKSKYSEQKKAKDDIESANLAKKNEILSNFRDLIQNEENLKKAFDRIKLIREEWKETGDVPRNKYQDLQNEYSKLSETFNYNITIYKELKEHDLKKNFSLKNQIVHQIEALSKEKDIKKIEKELGKLRNDWDEIGGTYKDKWEIIKEKYWTAVRVIYDKINAHYEDQRKVHTENLETKKALLEKLKPLASEKPESHKAWKNSTDQILAIQKEWKETGFSPRKETQVVWEEFRASCNDFFDRKKVFFASKKEKDNKNRDRKQALVDKVNEAKLSRDWREASQEIINLQKQWKKIGHAGPHAENKLWKQFRGACDEFFNAKEAHYNELEAEFEGNIKLKEDFIASIAAMEFPSDQKELMSKVREIGSEYSKIGDTPQSKEKKISAAYNKALQEKINALDIPKENKPSILFKAKVLGMKDAGDSKGLSNLKYGLQKDLGKLEDEINKAENNLGFFNISKGAEGLLAGVNDKINQQKKQVEIIKEKIKTINIASR